jgi:hypothetical protein
VQLTLSRLRDDAAAATEIAVATFLAGRGAPVAPPAGEVDPRPHRRDGFLVTFWRWVDHDPAREDPVAAGRALRHLLAAWTLVVAERAATEDAHADARRRIERALAYAREM